MLHKVDYEDMNIKSVFHSQQTDPESLFRLYLKVASISTASILMLCSVSIYLVFSSFVIKSAKTDSIQICHLLFDQQSPLLIKCIPGQIEQLTISTNLLPRLDQEMRKALHPFDIMKIKIYAPDSTIIYSTEASLIGKTNQNNLRLKNALAGTVDAMQVTKETAHDLAGEALFDVDVVETYVPIKSKSGNVLGSFEVYVNVSKYRHQIWFGLIVMTTIMAAVLAATFGFSYIFIRKGTFQLKEVQTKLEVIAVTDVLTGIANRRFAMEQGEKEFIRVVRNMGGKADASSLCCIMLDLDHFKDINDTKGHLAGDEVLREIGRRLRQSLRPYDIAGRYGGEEFLVLLPGSTFKEALKIAERIREIIRNKPVNIGGEEIRISASLGLSCFEDTDLTLDDLLKRADEALYKAKDSGRDRVESISHQLNSQASTNHWSSPTSGDQDYSKKSTPEAYVENCI